MKTETEILQEIKFLQSIKDRGYNFDQYKEVINLQIEILEWVLQED